MIVKYANNKIIIKDTEIIFLYVKYDRLILSKSGIIYDSESGDIYQYLSMEDVVCKLIQLFSVDLNTLQYLLEVEIYKLEKFIKDNIPNWSFIGCNKGYTASNRFEIVMYYDRCKINKYSMMYILSRYFKYFENNYSLKKKRYLIVSICKYHKCKESLLDCLMSIDLNFVFPIKEATNINLVTFLEEYNKYIGGK